jgi:hypothetical protein
VSIANNRTLFCSVTGSIPIPSATKEKMGELVGKVLSLVSVIQNQIKELGWNP